MYKYLINFCYSKTSQNCKYASTINLTVNHYLSQTNSCTL